MSDLIFFKIVIVVDYNLNLSEKNNLKYDVRESIEECGVQVSFIDFFQATKSDDESHPEIEELVLEVQVKCAISAQWQSHRVKYDQFCSNFKKHFYHLPCCYIMLYTNEAFYSAKVSRNEVTCQSIQFGVLPHDGYFHQYASLEKIDKVTFYHDTRNVVIIRENFEISFSYDNIRNVFVNIQTNPSEVFFDLFNPPIINRLEHSVQQNGRSTIIRHRNIDMGGKMDPDIIGRACVLCVSVYNRNMDLHVIISNIRSQCSSKPIYYSSISSIAKISPSANKLIKKKSMEFGCMYMMMAIFQRNFIALAQLSTENEYLDVVEFSKENPKALESALADVLSTLESGKILNYWNIIKNRYLYYVALRSMVNFKEYIVPPKCCMTRKITITPTRLLLWAPELLFGNRVVRNFDAEFAIRISFRDDNMRKLTCAALHADIGLMESCIEIPVSKGIRIGERHYEFLAWSNSQLRDHGIWMYAKDNKGITSADIRRWMGDFSHIHNVSKYMARMGQCFTQTVETISVPLEPHSIRTVCDIEGGYDPENEKPYIFSDGIGRISTELAKEVYEALGHDKSCSAFQIRFGGYKGMLVVDPTLKDTLIEFRESMKKFECNSNRLEIVRTSAPVPLQLNRPLIAILNDLGVRHRVFLRLQENMLKSITDMLFEEEKASKILKIKTQGMYEFEELSRAGIHLTAEPFFRSVLLAVHRHQIGLLKTKANVSIDTDYGRNMLGVLDETGILNYGEVFVQYSTDVCHGETIKETKILEGVVLVTKSPCHHAGDVRKFYAVDVPELHHIVDCIVFPQKGSRPHPNEMAGADLDGDDFSIIWLPELIFECGNKPAAHFPKMKSYEKPNITISDMINCLQEYIRKDQIGMISSAHLALADKLGIEADTTKSVAAKVSIAVDFAKTGEVIPLTKREKPREYPDFMENFNREEYKSIKALGKMYRICRDYETENKDISNMYPSIKVDPDLVYPGWEKYENDAIKMRNKYNAILASLLRNYGIEHEAEVVSTAFTELHCRYQERNDRMDVMKVVIACFKKLMSDFMLEFIEEFIASCDADVMDEGVMQKASAWYVVTYSDPEPKYLSFPWTAHKYLAIIKMRQNQSSPQPFSPAITEFDETIIKCEKDNLLPHFEETSIWQNYKFFCDPQIIKLALRVLILWATEEEILVTPGRHIGLLYVDIFVKLVFHVAELCKYVAKKDTNTTSEIKAFSSAKLCLEFLKFCSSLRFYNKQDISEILPFFVYKYTKLAKRAVVAYHRFALLGLFRNLYFDWKIDNDLINMNPIAIDFKVFGQNPIPKSVLNKAEAALKKYSKVEILSLSDHRQTRKVWITAVGSEVSIKDLKSIVRKKPEFLQELFKTGVMPQKDISVVDIVQNINGDVDMPQKDVSVVDLVQTVNGDVIMSEDDISVVDIVQTVNRDVENNQEVDIIDTKRKKVSGSQRDISMKRQRVGNSQEDNSMVKKRVRNSQENIIMLDDDICIVDVINKKRGKW